MGRVPGFALLVLLAASACARALREPPPLAALGAPAHPAAGEPSGPPADVDRLLREAAAAFGRRPDAAAVNSALDLFLSAARGDDSRVDGLIGAAQASSWLIEHDRDASRRERIATEAVQICQWCIRREPDSVECTYRLALAIGQQARERSTTALDGLKQMIPLLDQVVSRAPALDAAGGHRVLALVLLRAPGWPTGPGDPDAALEHARQADAIAPGDAQNLLALAEALAATDRTAEARAAYTRAESVARSRAATGDPDAAEWADAAARALRALAKQPRGVLRQSAALW
jgi:tetratricopeptide (TPR) repeat protein